MKRLLVVLAVGISCLLYASGGKSAELSCLDTITDLKALAPGAVKCSTVLGYHTPDDGGGGDFCWDAISTDPENGGTVFEPSDLQSSQTGRWKRLVEGNLSVKAQGTLRS